MDKEQISPKPVDVTDRRFRPGRRKDLHIVASYLPFGV